MSPTRREFVHALGAAALGGIPAFPDGIARIGIQLYTVRSLLDKDLDGTLAALRGIGYREVELAGLHGRTPAQFRAALDRAKLVAPSGHFELTALRNEWPRIAAEAVTLGHRYVVAAWIDAGERKTFSDYQRIAAELNKIGERAKDAGFGFAYHNHSYEFERIDGKLPYDVMLDETDKALVAIEMDIFWMVTGGRDPRAYFERYPGRFPMVHVKDRTKDGRMVDVGKGSIDFAKIIANAARGGVQHYYVEHDEPANPLDSARASFTYLDRLKIPKSKKAKKD